ncbi:MAG: Sec-independent protein translocase protein TatB [Pseudomonadota bacterium]
MFDIGFVELLICGIIALLILGPERLPTAARAAGRWVGGARRMMHQFSTELDRQLKADELREELRKAGDVGLEDVEKTVKDALDEAKRQEHIIRSEYQSTKRSATDSQAHGPDANNPDNPDPGELAEKSSDKSPDNRS